MNNKKIVKLRGGLGNQLFQYAFAYALAKKFGVEVVFDFSFFEEIKNFENETVREYELGIFDFECEEASKEDMEKVKWPQKRHKFKEKFWRNFQIKSCKYDGNCFLEKTAFVYEKTPLNYLDYYYYYGYFQSEKYFKDIREDILNVFSLKDKLDEKNKEVLKQIENTNSVSIHIRRGDYANNPFVIKVHGFCPLSYYKKAIKNIAKKVKNPHFYLFSDDVEWVIENLKIDYPYTVVDLNQGKGYFDMELMKNCKHNIIANSSFSWWAAWLNENPDKIVIAPKKWLASNRKCDIVPSQWIKL